MLFGKQLPRHAAVMVHTTPERHLEAYRFLEKCQKETLIVSLHRPISSLQLLLKRQGIPTSHVRFMDTVSKQASDKLLPDADYLLTPDLTILGQRIVHRLAQRPGEKVMVIDSLSTLRRWYPQAVISDFVRSLHACARDSNTQLVVLNEETLPALPNLRFDQVVHTG